MAALIVSTKVRGYTSATTSTAPTGGTVLGNLVTINVFDDGGITFLDSAGRLRKMDYSPELHALLAQITVGTNGVSSTKVWNKD